MIQKLLFMFLSAMRGRNNLNKYQFVDRYFVAGDICSNSSPSVYTVLPISKALFIASLFLISPIFQAPVPQIIPFSFALLKQEVNALNPSIVLSIARLLLSAAATMK